MANSTTSNIAFIFDDLTEFYALREVIDELISTKKSLDIIVPFDSGYNNIAKHTIKKIQALGYSPINDAPKNKKYKVILTPYSGMGITNRLNFTYHLCAPYGALSSKPNPTYTPNFKIDYDGIICFNKYEPEFLTAYGSDCYAVPYWKYYNFRKTKNKKPVLLILPTFGKDTSCVEYLSTKTIEDLQKHYKIIIKAHHAIHFNIDGTNLFEKLQALGVELHDSDTPITELFKLADIVLSDNSGAIFEAIYSNTPVAIFSKNPNSRRLETIDTLQYKLLEEGILPYTSQPKEILPMLLSTESYFKKQQAAKNRLFLTPHANSVQDFIKIIENYLQRDETKDYKKILRDIMVKNYHNNELAITDYPRLEQLLKETQSHMSELENYKTESEKVFNSRAYKLFNKTIKPYQKLKRRVNK